MIPTFLLLALAVVALWLGGPGDGSHARRLAWLGALTLAALSGVLTGVVAPVGLLAVATFTGLAAWFYHGRLPVWGRGLVGLALLVFAAALMLHRVPGFANHRVMDAVRFTPDARPFSLYLNFDKTLIGLALIGWGAMRVRAWRDWRALLRTALPMAAGLVVLLLGLSLAAGYVRWAPKWPAETWLWAAVNLGFVCLAEEALFRGFIQAELQRAWGGFRRGPLAALAVAALLFGLAHAAGGATYVALATVAGLGYGWIYQRTGRIEAPMLVHWTVNTVHFLLFTYPALA